LADLGRNRRRAGGDVYDHPLRQPERVKPGSPEYAEYIEHYIGECLRSPQAFDRTHSESLSEAEREAACRVTVQQADRLNPENRPLKHP
jgi:hypothetical protein